MFKEYCLNEKQMEFVENEWSKEYQHHGDGCLCGCYSCNIEGFGCLNVDVSCRKSSSCPDGMSWCVHDDIRVYNKSTTDSDGWEYTYDEYEEQGIKLLGYLNKNQAIELRDIVRRSIMRDYSPWGHDEFGNDPNEESYEEINESVCDFCKNRKDIVINPSPLDKELQPDKSIIVGDGLVLLKSGRGYGYIDIKYCPFCGGKLE